MRQLLLALAQARLALGLVCYFCSSEGVAKDEGCANQWQLDCGTIWGKDRPGNEEMLCRTSLMRNSANASFSIEKECVSETQHRQDFPGGRLVGCDKLMDDTGFEVTYCVCTDNGCNGDTITQQIATQHPVPAVAILPKIPEPIVNPFYPANRILGQVDQLPIWTDAPELEPAMRFQPSQPVPMANLFDGYESAWVPAGEEELIPAPSLPDHLAPSAPSASRPAAVSFPETAVRAGSPTSTPFPPLQAEDYHVRRAFFGEQPTAGSVLGLVCLVCREESVDGMGESGTGCSEQRAMDCSAQYPPGTPTFCFTRDSHLSSGTHVVEKLCVSDYALEVEYGEGAGHVGCSSVWGGRVQYCACNTDKCNEPSVYTQLGGSPLNETVQTMIGDDIFAPVADAPAPHFDVPPPPQEPASKAPSPRAPPALPTTTRATTTSTKVPVTVPRTTPEHKATDILGQTCFVCGESNLVNTTDCAENYEYDCGIQYPGVTDVLCLTRLTKLENEQVAIEKRCITEAQHREQYPGNEVVVEGCGDAWDGYVQYCVCRGPLCNRGGLNAQRGPVAPRQPSSTLPPNHSYHRTTTTTSPPPRALRPPPNPTRAPTTTPEPRTKTPKSEGQVRRNTVTVSAEVVEASSAAVFVPSLVLTLLLAL